MAITVKAYDIQQVCHDGEWMDYYTLRVRSEFETARRMDPDTFRIKVSDGSTFPVNDPDLVWDNGDTERFNLATYVGSN